MCIRDRPTSLSWPTTALRCRPPPRAASQARNTCTERSSASTSSSPTGPGSYRSTTGRAPPSVSTGRGPGADAAYATSAPPSQPFSESATTAPAVSAAPAPTNPRRFSMRSIPVNSVRTAAVRSGSHGDEVADCAAPVLVGRCRSRPRSSVVTTRPSRSVNTAASTLGTGSRGISPCSIHRRTREVSVDSCCCPIAAPRLLTSRASSPLDHPVRTNRSASRVLGPLLT